MTTLPVPADQRDEVGQVKPAGSDSHPAAETKDLPLGQTVCFDMDGLLVNTEPMWWRSEGDLMASYGGTWTDDDGRFCVGGPLEKVATLIIDRTGQGEIQAIISDLIGRMAHALRTEPIAMMPGAGELLRSCVAHGYRVALVSASPRILVDAVLESMGQEADLFEFSISSDDVEVSKPDPAPYLLAAARFGVTAADMIVLEDSPTGVAAAVAAGARVIAVPHLVSIPASSHVTVVNSLTEVGVEQLTSAHLG